ncbi:MAG: DUF4124 domain-containing protein [Synechococcaceae cyanobacterium SM1_2_3]|nr:DUF4124 domain-containing protein [Synechococcaceae cyanobacterium SM1_2_3]
MTAMMAAALLLPYGAAQTQQIYKWTDANGQVHYSQREPDSSAQAQKLDIAPPPPADSSSSSADATAEVARINALADQMARDREAVEKARQEQAARNLQLENEQLQNELLKQQAEQQKQKQEEESNRTIIGYPLPYAYPYPAYPLPHRPKPYPPDPGPPCQPCQDAASQNRRPALRRRWLNPIRHSAPRPPKSTLRREALSAGAEPV